MKENVLSSSTIDVPTPPLPLLLLLFYFNTKFNNNCAVRLLRVREYIRKSLSCVSGRSKNKYLINTDEVEKKFPCLFYFIFTSVVFCSVEKLCTTTLLIYMSFCFYLGLGIECSMCFLIKFCLVVSNLK